MLVTFKLNGVEVSLNVKENEYLLEALRKHGILSLKNGCNGSSCGVCTVLIDDKPILSCSYLASRVDGKNVTTVEGIQEEASLLAEYFADEGADQCGFCNSAFALIVHSLEKEYKNPTDDEIKQYLVGNLCRCTGYQSQFLAIKKYLEARHEKD